MIYFDGEYAPELARAIGGATRRVWVAMYVWRWYVNRPDSDLQRAYVALLNAQKRGLDVRVMTDFPEVAAKMRADGINAIETDKSRLMHAKMVLLDDAAVYVGSHNMTHRSHGHNHEATAVLLDTESILQAERYYSTVWSNYAKS